MHIITVYKYNISTYIQYIISKYICNCIYIIKAGEMVEKYFNFYSTCFVVVCLYLEYRVGAQSIMYSKQALSYSTIPFNIIWIILFYLIF